MIFNIYFFSVIFGNKCYLTFFIKMIYLKYVYKGYLDGLRGEKVNKKTYELLVYIIENYRTSFKIDELAEKFNVSNRSIRNYLAILIDFLNSNGIDSNVISTRDKIQYVGDKELSVQILELLVNKGFYDYKLSSNERVFIMVLLLLTTDKHMTLSNFEELLFVSKVTVSNDMKRVVSFLKDNSIDLMENKRKGYILDTSEPKRRDCLYYLIKSLRISSKEILDNSSQNISVWFFNNKLNVNIFSKQAELALSIVERHFKIMMPDDDYFDMVLILSIMLSRFADRSIITDFEQPNESEINVKIAQHLIKLMYDVNQNDYKLEGECFYLSKCLAGKHFMCENNTCDSVPPVDYYIIVKSFLYKLSNAFSINLLSDGKLQEYLTAHIAAMSNRIKNREKLINPYKTDLITNYKKEYHVIRQNLSMLEEAMRVKISDDEITYIMMHIIAVLEKLKRNSSLPRVLVLCHAGISTSHFLAENLKKHFKINVVDVTSSHYVQASMLRSPEDFSWRCDFIISTTPIIGAPVPWIQVNPVLTSDDIFKIHNMISGVSASMSQENLTEDEEETENLKLSSALNKKENMELNESFDEKILLSELITENHISLDIEASDWKEAIIKAGEPLLWSNSISVEYLMNMLNSVLENGPYFVFVPGFALAHAAPNQGAKRLDISFLRLKTPVEFGHKENDPVTFVIALSLAETKKNVEVILELMDVICSENAFEQFYNAKRESEIIDIFRKYEQKNF